MPEPAASRLNRIVQLVAELSRRQWQGGGEVPVSQLAREFDVDESQVLSDIRVLTEAGDDPCNTWLGSLSTYQVGNSVGISCRGPYRRPIRFTSEEMLALQVAVATEDDPPDRLVSQLGNVAAAGGDTSGPNTVYPAPIARGEEAAVVDVARSAIVGRRRVRISYAGEGSERPAERVIQPHLVVAAEGRFYLLALCENAGEWRRFRCDRVLEAELLNSTFEAHEDVPSIDGQSDLLSAPAHEIDRVEVRFSPKIARWLRERYPDATEHPDGSIVVVFPTTSAEWLVRMVLQYGAEAEVLGPPAYREAVKRVVG